MSAVMFAVTQILPADPARVAAGPAASESQVQIVRERLGLNKPLPEQYLLYVERLVRLNLGTSLISDQSVSQELVQATPVTIELVAFSVLCIVLISIPAGIIASVTRSKGLDGAIRLLALAGTGIAPFWLAILLQLLFFKMLHWFPVAGQIALSIAPPRHVTGAYLVDSVLTGDRAALGSSALHLVLPVAALTLGQLGILTRIVRVQMRRELSKDYTRTARAKGLARRRVVYLHVFRNALNPVLMQLGIQSGYLLTGAVFVESIFRFPGLGQYLIQAIQNLDFPAFSGVALEMSVMFVLINFAVDLAYATADPRIRY